MPPVESRSIPGPAGRLDSRWHGPVGGPPVLLLHPHPRFGGTMGSRLVHDLAVGLAAAGMRTVRFDFRGVGRSQGAYGEGWGEAEDAAAAFDALAQESGQVPAVVGYSFGGGVALRLAGRRSPRRLVLVATPLRLIESALDPMADAAAVTAPTTVVVGTQDGFVTPDEARTLAAAFQGPADVVVLEGAAHFLEPSQNGRAVGAVRAALAPRAAPAGAP